MCNLISHKLYLLSKIRNYITATACVTVFKTMILSLIEYGDIIYEGTTLKNIETINKLFYRGLRICCVPQGGMTKLELCRKCQISPLETRRSVHILIFMYKQLCHNELLNKSKYNTDYIRLLYINCISLIMKKPSKIYCIEVP